MLTLGHHVVQPVFDSVIRADPASLFPGTTREMWARHSPILERDGRLQFAIGAFLLRSRGRLALIDLGVGPNGWQAPSGAELPPGRLLHSLRALGVAPHDVTDVLLSHIHPDHVGWASVDEKPVFRNATYRCHADDWEHFVARRQGDATVWATLEAVRHRTEMWDTDATLFPGVDLIHAPGHTPGSTIITLSGASTRAVLLGDVAHCPVELLDDEWATIGDVDPELAKRTRARIARELEASDAHVTAAHFPELRFGRLVVAADGRRSWGYTA